MKQGVSQIKISIALTICCLATTNPTVAQVIPDATLPTNSIVTPQNNTNLIEGGTSSGSNLFHSFAEFSIQTDTQVRFNNSLQIQNIFSRVTGNSVSNIDGLIEANGTANLFLINPNGIIFGPNARLNIGGSFLASTANSIKFADGTSFSATAGQTTPLLTVSVPVGLQFGETPQRIVANKPVGSGNITIPPSNIDRNQYKDFPTVPPQLIVDEALTRIGNLVGKLLISRSGLVVKSGQTLALVGGDIALEGGILGAREDASTPGGRIELGSVAGGSSVSITPTAKGFALGYEGATGFGNINLSRGAFVDVSGSGSGEMQVRGDRVTLTDTSAIFAATLGNSDGGEFSIRAGELTVTGNSVLGAVTIAQGRSADISINATNLTVQKGFIGSLAGPLLGGNSTGDAGNLTIEVTDSINLRDSLFDQLPSGIFAATGNQGKGGNITISTGRLLARDGGQIAVTTGGTGKAGTIRVSARGSIQLIGDSPDNLLRSGIIVSSFGDGDAGDLIVETGELTVQGGAAISGATRIGAGGNVTVKVSGTAEVAGTTTVPLIPGARLFSSDISANTLGSGKAGNVFVQAERLIVRDGAGVTAATLGAAGRGPAGNLTVDAGSIRLDGGTISAETKEGNFGNINLRSGDLQMRNQSQITTNATGTGGNITINTDVLAALENSDITANSTDSRGGQVRISTQGIFGATVRREITPNSDISASSRLGPQFDGVVDIEIPEIDRTQGLQKVPQTPENARIATGCQATGAQQSSFTNIGMGGLPPNPTGPLSSYAIWTGLRSPSAASPNNNEPLTIDREQLGDGKIIEAQGWVRGANGEIILTAQAPRVTPYAASPTSSRCYAP
ncbi:filamentous hemagglutinin N-terminal domain-containing protein [Argonema galeatum]|uniref:two-partner secretion domain-containing protein n=1 Tax=Argonema galeatum TaxID=2942762 RepID=UPI002013130E|nr:filamentous hemagglutinin N-terminal domain-containing protein [Argonema galeatum]MCL1466080.1 filamentous hemagglutinin N-terminal domain-containing protein [Argonema galeatum A003/A1]